MVPEGRYAAMHCLVGHGTQQRAVAAAALTMEILREVPHRSTEPHTERSEVTPFFEWRVPPLLSLR